ncbi:MAG: NAD(P)H-dependent oxidoreductase subunit E [Kiritimatiellae bacterium]|nr:NAD(P)H-dependent oxidoreductase subunit E [Kiritimatiellia bacterium]MDD5522802.1 NAD(P)H-dependent oxidoreductase subunit E [Kiritimatiellia bacterium]
MKSTGKKKKRTVISDEPDNCTEEDVKEADILAIVRKHDGARGGLIAMLEGIQQKYGYLPENALRILSNATGRSLVDIYGVATFYRSFTLHPRGKHLVTACLGTACHVRAAPRIVEELEQQLGIKASETTPDRNFTLETVNCLGACALGPVVVIDGHYFSKVKTAGIKKLIEEARNGFPDEKMLEREFAFPVEASCPQCHHSLMDAGNIIEGYPSIRVDISAGEKSGWLRLVSLYGSRGFESEHELPVGESVAFFCPHCKARIAGTTLCTECEATMAGIRIGEGALLQICERRGCDGCRLELDAVKSQV